MYDGGGLPKSLNNFTITTVVSSREARSLSSLPLCPRVYLCVPSPMSLVCVPSV